LRHPDFAREGNVPLAGALNRNQQPRAAALFLRAVHRDPNFNWSRPLIDLLGQLPPEQTQEVWRRQWSNWAWRDELTVKLARRPDPLDHPKFVAGLDSLQFEVADVCLAALLTLPPDDSPQNLLPLMRLLGRLAGDPKYQGLRRQAILLLNKQTGQNFAIKEANADASKLPALYQPVYDWFAAVHPQLARQLMAETGDDSLARLLKMTAWNKGIAARGETQFNQRGCVACHGGTSPLGPDLTGVTSRLTPLELFRKIAYPSRKISEAYRPANFRLKNGQTITGLVIFESADVYLVQTGPAATMRLSADAMAAVHPGKVSLMPPNLLQGLQPSDLADLYACLKKFP
jgi:putative heme-binding domain-containing protein